MSSERIKVKLGDIVDIFTGFPFKSAQYSENPGDIKLIRGDNIAQGVLRWDGVKRWPVSGTEKLDSFWLKENDVLLAMDRPWIPAGLKFARVYLSDLPCLLVQRVACLRAKSGQDQNFIYSLLSTPAFSEYIQNVTTGTAVPHISVKQIKEFELEKLTLADEREIGLIHGIIDSRIKLLRETNATLEAIAQALFKSWFVDFDPVHANAAFLENGQAPSLPAEIQALFPSRLVESPQGLIPEGWEWVSLKEATQIFDSKRIPLSGQDRAKRKGPYPYYGAASLMDWVDDFIFDGIYLLMGEDGSVADKNGFPIIQYVWGKIWVNNHAHVLQGKNGISTEHLMLAVKGINIQPYMTGAVQAKLSQSNMWRIQFLMPTKCVAEAFAKHIEPLFTKIRANSEQAITLENLRDALLPRLISGQLRLPEAEAPLAEVG